MIERMKYYVNRVTVGPYHVYLALEDANESDELIQVLDLTSNSKTFIMSKNVYEVDTANIEDDFLQVANSFIEASAE